MERVRPWCGQPSDRGRLKNITETWLLVESVVPTATVSQYDLGQLSLLPSAGWEMSTSQSAVMLCGWGVKAGMVHSTCG